VLLILVLQHYGARRIEAVIVALVLTIGACLAFEPFLARPDWGQVASGFAPGLYVAIGILGATVMPHNLYLHSALVSTRAIGTTTAAKREALRYNRVDTLIALNFAFLRRYWVCGNQPQFNRTLLIPAKDYAVVFHDRQFNFLIPDALVLRRGTVIYKLSEIGFMG